MLTQLKIQEKVERPVQKSRPKVGLSQVEAHEQSSLRLQRYLGSQRLQRLAISRPGDASEQEAERVADQVMRGPGRGQMASLAAAGDQIQRACSCEEDELKRSASGPAPDTIPASVNQVLRTGGQTLDSSAKAFFEDRFGQNFSRVTIHADSASAASAQAVRARAYTVGEHIVFGKGEYSPQTQEGRYVLAHELAHVVQQTGSTSPTQSSEILQRMPATSDCTATDVSEITAAYPVAQAMVRKAIRVIGATPTPAVDGLLRKYFNDDSVSTRLHTLIGYNNLVSGMGGSFTVECEHQGSFLYDHFCGGVYAYVRAFAGFAGNVHICEGAFGRSVNDLAETIIHECSHKFDNTDDEAYCWGGCPGSLDRWDAYDNADSFSKFAWEAYTTIP